MALVVLRQHVLLIQMVIQLPHLVEQATVRALSSYITILSTVKNIVNPFMSYMCYPYIHFLSMCPFLDPIDLTQDDDLQKALALSLQDMQHQNGGISLEEQELSRCVL